MQEFEIIFDAAEIIEDEIDRNQGYKTEWSPYDDEDFQIEDYEHYDDDDEDPYNNGY